MDLVFACREVAEAWYAGVAADSAAEFEGRAQVAVHLMQVSAVNAWCAGRGFFTGQQQRDFDSTLLAWCLGGDGGKIALGYQLLHSCIGKAPDQTIFVLAGEVAKQITGDPYPVELTLRILHVAGALQEATQTAVEQTFEFHQVTPPAPKDFGLFTLLTPEQIMEKISEPPVAIPNDAEGLDDRNLRRWWRHIATGRQIGQMFEFSVGYRLEQEEWSVDYHGARMGLDDSGRDIIARKGGRHLVAQCKYQTAPISAKAIFYLFGSAIAWRRENASDQWVDIVFYSHSDFDEEATKAAGLLNVQLYPFHPFHPFPAVRCKTSPDGRRLFHLPWQPNYRRLRPEAVFWTVQQAVAHGYQSTKHPPPNWLLEAGHHIQA